MDVRDKDPIGFDRIGYYQILTTDIDKTDQSNGEQWFALKPGIH